VNSLNSIIIEGVLIKAPSVTVYNKTGEVVSFKIRSHRRIKNGSTFVREDAVFSIEVESSELKEKALSMKPDTGVRLCGRLRMRNSKVVIVPETIDIRLGLNK
jgi:hypothetical protein